MSFLECDVVSVAPSHPPLHLQILASKVGVVTLVDDLRGLRLHWSDGSPPNWLEWDVFCPLTGDKDGVRVVRVPREEWKGDVEPERVAEGAKNQPGEGWSCSIPNTFQFPPPPPKPKQYAAILPLLPILLPPFVSAITSQLSTYHNIDTTPFHLDHACFRCSTVAEYDAVKSEMYEARQTLLVEGIIGGRPISTYALHPPIICGDRLVDTLEVPAPKFGSPYASGLEHVEFVIPSEVTCPVNNEGEHEAALRCFVASHPSVEFDTRALEKRCNPDVSMALSLGGGGAKLTVKFHLMALRDVVEYEKANGMVQAV